MDLSRAREVLAGAIAVAILAALVASAYFGVAPRSEITLINRSVETISEARLKQGDRETVLGPVEPGRMRSADFVAREGSLTLVVTLESGRTLSAVNVGYIAPALPATVFFNVTEDKVALLYIVNRKPSNYSKR